MGQCADGPSAVEMVLNLKPDFAILDMQMPGMTGVETIRKLRAAGCTSKLMILSVSREDNTVLEALRAGADAYLLKDGPSRHLLEAITFRARRRSMDFAAAARRGPVYQGRKEPRGGSAGDVSARGRWRCSRTW